MPRQHKIVDMAAVCNSVYYDCLKEFQDDIVKQITQNNVNVDRLMKKAKKKAFLSSGYYVEPDSGELVASREKTIATFVSCCIDSVKRNESQFQHFLTLLEEIHLKNLVHLIQRKLEQSRVQKPIVPTHGKILPLSDDLKTTSVISTDSGISTSARRSGPSLPPLVAKKITSQSRQHLFHSNNPPRQSVLPSGLGNLRSRSFSDDKVNAEKVLQILTLRRDKKALRKQLQEKDNEIEQLKAALKIEKQMGKYQN